MRLLLFRLARCVTEALHWAALMSVPIIMVGPGTGLAPFRAFIMHRQLGVASEEASGEAVLYFGCRHRAKDFLYGASAAHARVLCYKR